MDRLATISTSTRAGPVPYMHARDLQCVFQSQPRRQYALDLVYVERVQISTGPP